MEDASMTAVDKKAHAEEVLGAILKHMEFPARLESKDMADGGISFALHPESELPGMQAGKRTFLLDCLQLLVNKAVNRPQGERRFVALGVGQHSEPRNGRAQVPVAAVSAPGAPNAPPPPRRSGAERHSAVAAAPVDAAVPARAVKVDPELAKFGKALAEKVAANNRYLALLLVPDDDAAGLAQSAAKVKGVSVKLEGQAHLRRLTYSPANPVLMPKRKAFQVFDVENDD